MIRSARRPLIVAGGGVIYAEATEALRAFAEATGIPVAETQAGKGSLPYDHPLALGAIGATGTTAANALAREADVVIGIGTRYTDFTTASRTVFADPDVRFVNLNVAAFDAAKHAGVAGGRRRPGGARGARRRRWPAGRSTPTYRRQRRPAGRRVGRRGRARVPRRRPRPAARPDRGPRRGQRGVRRRGTSWSARPARCPATCTSCGGPGTRKGYHVEYGYSCMGYEIAGGLGVRAGRPGPGGLRPGRRRLVPDDGPGDRHRGPGGRQAHRRAGAEPRLRLHRRAVRVARLAAVRHPLPLPRRRHRPARRRRAARRPGRQRRQPRRPGAARRTRRGAARGAGRGQGAARRPGRGARRDRPAGAGAGQRGLVGRAGRRGLRAGLAPRQARKTYEASQGRPAAATCETEGESR